MKVLILSCNTGEGHNSCAAALEEECRNQNIPCATEDALRFISPEVSRFISNWHVRIYRHAPGLFRVGYRAAEDHPAQFHEGSALYRYLTQGAEKLCGFIAGSGYDTVICTHTFAALMVSFPVIANQLWKFVAPGLYRKEKRALLPFLFATPVLFAVGASFAYFITIPIALKFLLGYHGEIGGVTQEAVGGGAAPFFI